MDEFLLNEFLLRSFLGGIGIAIVCGPLGCLMIWQRMAYFGAALSHAALLGIALGLFFKINLYLCILFICILLSLVLLYMERFKNLTSDTALGILAHATLALGIVVLSMVPSVRMDLMAYLFGDILSINWSDILWIYSGGIIVISILLIIWKPLLSLIVQRDLALVDGVNEGVIRLVFLVLLSVAVAISMQVVGILLVVSMLIIPGACARRFSHSPEQMAIFAIITGCLAIITGLLLSLMVDTPAGPSIVVTATGLFIISLLIGRK